MKKLLGIVVLGLLLSSNAYAKKIKLVCVDNEEDAVFNIKINTSNKTVIVDGRTESIKITEDEFEFLLVNGDLSRNFIINRNSGTYRQDSKLKNTYQSFYGKCEVSKNKF